MRWWFATLLVAHCAANSWENSTCIKPDFSLTPHCKRFIEKLPGLAIPSDFNESTLDLYAYEASMISPQCPFFNLEFHCLKIFFRCSNSTGEVLVQGMCSESCLEAKTWQTGACRSFDLDTICLDPRYFDPKPDCFVLDEHLGTGSSLAWSIVLVCLIVIVTGTLIGSIVRTWLKDRRFAKNPDESIEFDDEKKKAAKITAAKEKQGDKYANLELAETTEDKVWTSAQEARRKVSRLEAEKTPVVVPGSRSVSVVNVLVAEPQPQNNVVIDEAESDEADG